MKKKRLSLAAIAIIVPITLLASTATQDYVTWDESWNTAVQSYEPTHMVGRFTLPPVSNPDVNETGTYAYSYSDIVIFSYDDHNECEVIDSEGHTVWSGIIWEDDYELISNLSVGIYKVTASKGFSVLGGDPFKIGLGCWYAVDQNSRPLSTKFLSIGPGHRYNPGDQTCVIIFAYQDSTHIVFIDLDADSTIWEGDLDSLGYHLQSFDVLTPIAYSIESSKPVSTMTGGGVVGMYAPAFNGAFTGRDFMTYQHYWMELTQDIQIIPWENNTTVTITNLDDPADTIWKAFCERKGEIKGTAINSYGSGPRALYIHADKDISVSQSPWTSYGGNSTIAFYMIRGINREGLGLGTEFYIPVEQSLSDGYYSRLHVIAFLDSTEVTVTRIPRNGGDETTIWEGTLQTGEFYRYTCPVDASAHAIYHVTSSRRVATIANCNDEKGSDFSPVVDLVAIGISEDPEVSPSLDWQVLNTVGREVVLQYSNHPEGFHASVFDATGRRIDEITAEGSSGTISWPVTPGYSPGVFFIRVEAKSSLGTQKVVLIK